MASIEGPLEDVRRIAETCEKLVEDVVHGRCSMEEFGEGLRNTGISPEAGGDYVREVQLRLESQLRNGNSNEGLATAQSGPDDNGPAGPITPALGEPQTTAGGNAAGEGVPSAGEVNEEIAWGLLRSKLNQLRQDSAPASGGQHLEGSIADLFKTLVPTSSSNSLVPATVLAVAPHLSKLSEADSFDGHLRKTWELRQAFSSEKAMDPIIDLMQSQPLQDPIPCSIWRKILRDEFVDFEQLYGSTNQNYSHQDDHEEFAGGFVLSRKEQVFSKKFICTEADWSRIYSAWEAGVILLYPH